MNRGLIPTKVVDKNGKLTTVLKKPKERGYTRTKLTDTKPVLNTDDPQQPRVTRKERVVEVQRGIKSLSGTGAERDEQFLCQLDRQTFDMFEELVLKHNADNWDASAYRRLLRQKDGLNVFRSQLRSIYSIKDRLNEVSVPTARDATKEAKRIPAMQPYVDDMVSAPQDIKDKLFAYAKAIQMIQDGELTVRAERSLLAATNTRTYLKSKELTNAIMGNPSKVEKYVRWAMDRGNSDGVSVLDQDDAPDSLSTGVL